MDLDITTPAKIQEHQPLPTDPFDLLGSSSLQNHQSNTNNINLFEAFPPSTPAYNPPSASSSATELLMGISTAPSQTTGNNNYTQSYKIQPKQSQNFNFNSSLGSNNLQVTNFMGISYENGVQSQLSQPKGQSAQFSLSLNNGVFLM